MTSKTLNLTISQAVYKTILNGQMSAFVMKYSNRLENSLFHSNGTTKKYESVKLNVGVGAKRAYIIADYQVSITLIKEESCALYNGTIISNKIGDFFIYIGKITEYRTRQGLTVITSLSGTYKHSIHGE